MTVDHFLKIPHLKFFHAAYAIAADAHKNQKRNDGKTPYMAHVHAVIANTYYRLSAKNPDTENILRNPLTAVYVELYLVVAALHDVVEDCEDVWPMKRIVEEFDKAHLPVEEIELVVDAVWAITKKPKGTEMYIAYVLRVKNNRIAKIVKLADLDHNMSDLKPGNMLDKYSVTKYVLES